MKRMVVLTILLLLFSIVAIIFITETNDHKECEIKTEIVFGAKGEKTVTDTHVCKEVFNL